MLIIGIGFSIKRTTPYVVSDAYHFTSEENIIIGSGESFVGDISFTSSKWYGLELLIENPSDYSDDVIWKITESDTGLDIYSCGVNAKTGYAPDDYLAQYLFDNVIKVDPKKSYSLEIINNGDMDLVCHSNDLHELWMRPMYLFLSTGMRVMLSILVVSVLIICLYIVMFNLTAVRKFLAKPENLFLFGALVMGLLYLIMVPPFKVPDTINHYVRSYEITKGYFLVPEGGIVNIPWNLIPYETYTYNHYVLSRFFKMTIDTTNQVEYDVVNMALYSPISYILQALGIGIADIFSNNTYVLMLVGSVFNLAGCTAIIYYAIKYIPYGKWVLVFFSLTPLNLQQRSSLSVDALTYAVSVAMLAFCLYWRYEKKEMTRKSLILMYVLIMMMASVKIVYFVIAALVLFIPRESFAKGKAWIHKTLAMIWLSVFSFGWLAIASSYIGNTRGGSESSEKINIILHSPFRYIYILNKTLWDDGADFLLQMFGRLMGSVDIEISSLLMIIVLLGLIGMFVLDKPKGSVPDVGLTAFTILLSVGMVVLVFTSLYIQWTNITAATYSIEGIQGRYMIPIAPVLLAGLLAHKKPVQAQPDRLSTETGQKTVYMLLCINIVVLLIIWGYISMLG